MYQLCTYRTNVCAQIVSPNIGSGFEIIPCQVREINANYAVLSPIYFSSLGQKGFYGVFI